MHASYSAFSRLVHWLTLLLMICLFAIAWTLDDIQGPLHGQLTQLHKSFGITVLALTVLRLVWRFVAGVPALPPDLPGWQKVAARLNETILYLLLLAQPTVGWLWSSANTKPINFYFLVNLPWVIPPDQDLSHRLAHMHGLIANLLLVFIGLHALAALYHHFIRRDRVLLAMLGK